MKFTFSVLLASILFQRCNHKVNKDLLRAEKIFKVLTLPEYSYVLKSYINVYSQRALTPAGKNLLALMDLCGAHVE